MKRQLIILAIPVVVMLSGCSNDLWQPEIRCYQQAELNCGENNIRYHNADTEFWYVCHYRCEDYSKIKDLVNK